MTRRDVPEVYFLQNDRNLPREESSRSRRTVTIDCTVEGRFVPTLLSPSPFLDLDFQTGTKRILKPRFLEQRGLRTLGSL